LLVFASLESEPIKDFKTKEYEFVFHLEFESCAQN
jgi:hypothetical protein